MHCIQYIWPPLLASLLVKEKKDAIDEAVAAALALRKSIHDKELADIKAAEEKARLEATVEHLVA